MLKVELEALVKQPKEQRGQQVLALKELLVQMVQMVHKAAKVLQELREDKEQQGQQVVVDRVFKGILALMVLKVTQAQPVVLVLKDILGVDFLPYLQLTITL